MMQIPVILDTDIGSDIDDTWALAAMLRSAALNPLLVLTTSGDTRYRAALTAKFLHSTGYAHIPVGVGIHHGAMKDEHRHQGPWLGEYELEQYPGPVHRDGISALCSIIRASEVPVTLISIAPCFNIAWMLAQEPDLARKCHFVGMHGSLREGYGPGSPPEPETNVRLDVEGFRSVLRAPWLSLRITPLDTCGRFYLAGERYARIKESDKPLAVACMENYRIWARRVDWMMVDFEEERTSTLFDNVAVAMAYTDAFWEFETLRIAVLSNGKTVEDPEGCPAKVAIRWKDLDGFADHVTALLLG